VAAMLEEAGLWMGGDLNESRDNLWFTLLFKHPAIVEAPEPQFRHLVSHFIAAMTGDASVTSDAGLLDELVGDGRPQHDTAWLRARAQSLTRAMSHARQPAAWGWKEPNTHIVLDRLQTCIPELRYIHVVRNGLDMAFSANQNQLNLWGSRFLGSGHGRGPREALKFWCRAHMRIAEIGEEMGARFLFLRFEDLCRDPVSQARAVLSFVGVQGDEKMLERAAGLVAPPKSIGRYAQKSLAEFDPDDIAYVSSLGFDV
jgi:hypothetical protein